VNSERRVDVLVVGDLFLDLVMSGFESWPNPGEESFATEFHKEVGGGAAITACGLARLGFGTFVLGVVGKSDGAWMVDELRSRDVDVSVIRVSDTEPTAFTVSVSTAQDRALFTYGGANREFAAALETLVGLAKKKGVRHVHLAHAVKPAQAETLFREIHEVGCSLSLDVGWHPNWLSDAQAIAALRLVDVFFPNEREAAVSTKETNPRRMLEAFQRMGLRQVALKLGSEGAGLLSNGEIIVQPSGPVEVVDTTGAGDCFDAGFLYAWLHGMEPRQCLRAAAACGEMSVRVMGGIAGAPSREELESLLCTAR
jgi:sugar/nucleoside kinase (ribokinase family)